MARVGLGDALVLLGNRSEAVGQFEQAARLDSHLELAKTKAAALKCDLQLEAIMQEVFIFFTRAGAIGGILQQHDDLVKMYEDKKSIRDLVESVEAKESALMRHLTEEAGRAQAALVYLHHIHGTALPRKDAVSSESESGEFAFPRGNPPITFPRIPIGRCSTRCIQTRRINSTYRISSNRTTCGSIFQSPLGDVVLLEDVVQIEGVVLLEEIG